MSVYGRQDRNDEHVPMAPPAAEQQRSAVVGSGAHPLAGAPAGLEQITEEGEDEYASRHSEHSTRRRKQQQSRPLQPVRLEDAAKDIDLNFNSGCFDSHHLDSQGTGS